MCKAQHYLVLRQSVGSGKKHTNIVSTLANYSTVFIIIFVTEIYHIEGKNYLVISTKKKIKSFET